ncbi:hypothetical protein [Crenobacter cavernae]|uniref:Uncharacterized protein n=1 Tax=Crenobacter cavernae TaxID=2290923 RepID=A0A345Y4W4_9NEIS|nr:hypothetical protein [Crenobacter cavernae]AXK38966.1 hypothetical protein DWG20_05690 [Crenobacter cavernae]
MLAYHEYLVPAKPSVTATMFGEAIDANFFATVGFEPKNVRSLSLAEWAEFMLGEPYVPTSNVSSVSMKGHESQSLIKRVIAWFKVRT